MLGLPISEIFSGRGGSGANNVLTTIVEARARVFEKKARLIHSILSSSCLMYLCSLPLLILYIFCLLLTTISSTLYMISDHNAYQVDLFMV